MSERVAYPANVVGKGKIIAEVGVWRGENARKLFDKMQPSEIHLIDPWTVYPPEEQVTKWSSQLTQDDMDEALANTCRLLPHAKIKKMTSEQAAGKYPDAYFDFVYIDGSHTYKRVKQDIHLWYPKIKKGGMIGGHDFAPTHVGVMAAVLEWLYRRNQTHLLHLADQELPYPSWFLQVPA